MLKTEFILPGCGVTNKLRLHIYNILTVFFVLIPPKQPVWHYNGELSSATQCKLWRNQSNLLSLTAQHYV